MLKLDNQTVGGVCNSLNAMEGMYHGEKTALPIHLRQAQELIWLLWDLHLKAKGMRIPELGLDYKHSGKPIGTVLYSESDGITIQLTDEAKHDQKIMKFFGFDRVVSMSFEIVEDKNHKSHY